jgi:hypothetical protein
MAKTAARHMHLNNERRISGNMGTTTKKNPSFDDGRHFTKKKKKWLSGKR